MRKIQMLFVAVLYWLIVISTTTALDIDVYWTCHESSLWTNINCWNPNTHIPDNDNGMNNNYHVHFDIGGDLSSTIDNGNSIEIDTLELSQLTIIHLGPNGPGFLTIEGGQVVNDGFINVASNHWDTAFRINGDTTFSSPAGTGAVVIGNDPHHRIEAVVPGSRIINETGHSFQGATKLGNDSVLFTNHGTIQSDIIDAYLYINPYDSGINYNDGVIDSIISSHCFILPSTWDNTNGLIHASDNCRTVIAGASIEGGALASDGTGVVQVYENGSLTDVTITSGKLTIPNENGATAFLSGTIINNAIIEVANDHWSAHLRLMNDTTLAGSGYLFIGNYGRNYLDSDGTIRVLTNSENHTIRGGDYLGNSLLVFNNLGTIQADIPGGTLLLDAADTETSVSSGMLKATNMGILNITTGSWDCANGKILAEAGSTVMVTGATVANASFETQGDGYVEIHSGSELTDFTVPTSLQLQIPDWATSNMSGEIMNNGTMTLKGQNAKVFFNLTDNTSLDGSGTCVIDQYAHIKGTGQTLTSGAEHSLQIVSSCTCEPDFINSGNFHVTTNVTPIFEGSFSSTVNSVTHINGQLTASQGMSIGGKLSGTGNIESEITMMPDSILSPGENTGTLTLGELGMESGSVIDYELDTNGDDLIIVNGDATFSGTIAVKVTAPADYLPTGEDHIIFQVGQKISDMPTWNIQLPDGWTSDGISLEGSNIVLKNVLLPFGVRLDMPTMVHIGDEFHVTGLVDNPGSMATDIAVFFILQVNDNYWFYDSWSHYAPPEATDIDFVMMDIPPGTTEVEVLPSFTWPDTGPAKVEGLLFWGAALTSDMSQINGRFTQVEWGYGP